LLFLSVIALIKDPYLAAVGHLFRRRIDGPGKELFRGKEIFSSKTVK
jgi:hypothetical protein